MHLARTEDIMTTTNPAALGAQTHAMRDSRSQAPRRRATTNWRRIVLALLASTMLGGCVAEASIPPPAVAVAYSPYYYAGYPVYYDTIGAPFVYIGGGVHYVPRSYAHYDVLVRGYHGPHYYEGPRYYSNRPRNFAGRPRYDGAPHYAAPHYHR
jgi:hypothetical protein